MLAGYLFNPEVVTNALGIKPTSTNSTGASSTLDKPSISTWELSTDTVENIQDVYELVDILIKQLEPVEDKIIEISKIHNLSPRITVVLTLSADQDATCPDVGFGGRAVRLLADIGAFPNIEYEIANRT